MKAIKVSAAIADTCTKNVVPGNDDGVIER